MNRTCSLLVLLLTTFPASPAIAAQAPTEAELKERFAERLDELQSLKDAGKVGETARGLVAVRESKDAAVEELVGEENADRRRLYVLIGKRTDESPDAVARQAAIRNFRRAKPSHWLELRNGQWVRKRELPDPK